MRVCLLGVVLGGNGGYPQTALTDVKSADLPSKPTQTRATELGEKEPEGSQAKHAAALSGFGVTAAALPLTLSAQCQLSLNLPLARFIVKVTLFSVAGSKTRLGLPALGFCSSDSTTLDET